MSHLDDNMSFPGTSAVQFTVLLHHDDLSFFLDLLHVLLHLVEDAAVVLLGYTHKLDKSKTVFYKCDSSDGLPKVVTAAASRTEI